MPDDDDDDANTRSSSPDSAGPPRSSTSALLDGAGNLRDPWAKFRAGDVAPCPGDGAPLALVVDGAAGVYRFVCTRCGVASAWFEAGPKGLRIRGLSQPGRLGEDTP